MNTREENIIIRAAEILIERERAVKTEAVLPDLPPFIIRETDSGGDRIRTAISKEEFENLKAENKEVPYDKKLDKTSPVSDAIIADANSVGVDGTDVEIDENIVRGQGDVLVHPSIVGAQDEGRSFPTNTKKAE